MRRGNEVACPFALLEKYAGVFEEIGGQAWKANFYKCGSETSHPHWGSWSAIDALNFHLPAKFGDIRFAK